jgi:sugar phosphate isomerase/epimerase
MIRLAFSTNAFKKNSIDEAIDAIARVGYSGVEVMADVPHALPARLDAKQIAEIKRRIDGGGQSCSNINAFTLFACGDTYHPTWIENDEKFRAARVEHTIRSVELAAALGATTVSLQPGGPLIGTMMTRGEAGKRYADGLSQVLPRARALNITLAVEPEPGLYIQTADEYLAFKNEFFAHEDQIKMNCDIGHLFCVGDEPADVVRKLAPHVAHVHLEDIGKNRVHQHLTPGKGVIDFADVFAALNEVDYKGWVTVELYPYETTAAGVAKRAWEHLRPIVNSMGG